MAALPKGLCEVCARLVPIRRNGTAREHNNGGGFMCAGSGRKIDPLEQLELSPAVGG